MRSKVQNEEAKNRSYFFAFNIKLALKVHEGWVDQKVKERFKLAISEGVQAGHTVGQVVAGGVRPAELPSSGRRVEV